MKLIYPEKITDKTRQMLIDNLPYAWGALEPQTYSRGKYISSKEFRRICEAFDLEGTIYYGDGRRKIVTIKKDKYRLNDEKGWRKL